MWIERFTIKISTKLQYTAHVGKEMNGINETKKKENYREKGKRKKKISPQ